MRYVERKSIEMLACFCVLLTLLAVSEFDVCAQDGVLQSGGARPQQSNNVRIQVNQRMSDYVQQAVINTVLQETSTIFTRILQRQNINILPQIVYQAIEQTAMQLFEQESSSEAFRDAFSDAYDKTMEMLDNGSPLAQIQSEVQASIKKDVAPVFEGRMFKFIIEEMLKKAMQSHQKVVAMTMMQRQAQVAMIEKQRQMLQQAMVQQVQKAFMAYQQQMVQDMTQKYQQAAANQMDEQYKASLQQQYDQQLQALHAEMQSQYDQAVLQALSSN